MAKRFRAYALKTVQSHRNGETIDHDVEEVIAEGRIVDGKASFDAGGETVTRVVFYDGPAAEEVVVGSADVGQSGQLAIDVPAVAAE